MLSCMIFLSGCGSANGPLYNKSYVLDKVAEQVPNEHYKLDRVEKVKDADVATEIYYFKSKDRDFEFRAINTRKHAFYDSGLYAKALYVKYDEDVHKLYEEEINNILVDSGYTLKHNRFYIYSFDELNSVADAIARADDAYKKEMNYNSPEWMIEYPAHRCLITLKQVDSDEKEISYSIGGVEINGTWDRQKLYDYLCFKYASCILNGNFEDSYVPENIMKTGHVTSLKHVYINGIEVSETAYLNSKANGSYNNTDSAYYADYCYKLGDYVLPFNTAVVPKDCAPHAVEEYLSVLCSDYDIEYNKGKINWERGGSDWKSVATADSRGYINSFSIYKNGEDCHIPYVKCSEWTSPVHGVYVVGITVHDFARIFDLSIEIDEENSTIYFSD